ncbi:hypothetical protein RN001_004360 [Aquatica leii]|uniref:acid phosphatase n=1 Tax=Aquatica leii TaxID=1421715 RepID=A0AAN7SA26_9COLE|nr:hypothetical protein RN001_004360 [Aquatica leii]
MVTAVFRHGQKASDPYGTYPQDPLINETYYPYGPGELTNVGKRMEYTLGKRLRERYGNFLNNLYTPDKVYAISTYRSRAKMSLELVLAGLFPPKRTLLEWEQELNWQPIPFDSLPQDNHLMEFAMFNCPKYVKLYTEYSQSLEASSVEKKYQKYYNYIADNTGMDVANVYDIFFLYLSLDAEKDWGLELPSWTHVVFPELLKEAAVDFYSLSSATPQLKQLAGGFLLKKIVNDTLQKINHTLRPPSRKMFLYSGHEYNVAFLLNALNVYYPHIPPFGSCVLVELHNVRGTYGIKINYMEGYDARIKPLKIPGCEIFCPIKTFMKLLTMNMPENGNACDV